MNRRTLLKTAALTPFAALASTRPQQAVESHHLVIEGNSISANNSGANTYGNFVNWAMMFVSHPWAVAHRFSMTDVAVGGVDITDAATRAKYTVDPLLNLPCPVWLVVFENTNQLDHVNGDVEACWQAHKSYCLARRAAGFTRIGIGTGISRTPFVKYTWAQMQAYNEIVRVRYTECADFVVDFAADPIMGAQAAYDNHDYFTDGSHTTHAGNAHLRNTAIAAFQQQIGTSFPRPANVYYAPQFHQS